MSNVPAVNGLQFEQFVAEIDRLATERGLIKCGEQYYYAESWREMWEDGLTPEEALDEELRDE